MVRPTQKMQSTGPLHTHTLATPSHSYPHGARSLFLQRWQCRTHFENNDPRNALLGLKSDLIVVGARGHGAVLGLLLGSVADYVSRHAKVPVVIVPAN